jgi:PAS domain S-box-containing protein
MLFKGKNSIRFIISVAATIVVLFLSYALLLGHKETHSTVKEYRAYGQRTAEFLAFMAAEPLLTYNYSALEQYAEKMSGDREQIQYVVFTDNEDDELITAGNLDDSVDIEELISPIMMGNDKIGSVRVGLDISKLNYMVRRMQLIHIAETAIVAALVMVIIILLFRTFALQPMVVQNKAILDSIESIICVTDLASFKVIYANKCMKGIYGDVEGKALVDVIGEGGSPYSEMITQEKLRSSVDELREPYRLVYRDAECEQWYEARMKTIEWADGITVALYVARDITEQKAIAAEREKNQKGLEMLVNERTQELNETISMLRKEISEREKYEKAHIESEFRLFQIFSQDDDALIIFSADDYKILDINSAALELFGYSKDDLMKQGISPIFSPDNANRFINSLNIQFGDNVSKIDNLQCSKKDGTQITVSIRRKYILMLEEDIIYCSFRDITDKIRIMKETQLMQAKLIHANKMASLGVLVSGVAHEINNPNNFIMFNSELMSDAWKDIKEIMQEHKNNNGDTSIAGLPLEEMTEAIPKLLAGVHEGSLRIKKIVENLRQFARQDASSLDDTVMLDQVVSNAVSLINYSVNKYTDNFIVDIQDTPAVMGSAQQLEQVLINLIVNALQAIDDKKKTVRISLSIDKARDEAVIKVIDEGIGMSPDMLERIRDPFFTTKLEEGGTGLGLSISYSIINDHNGFIEFESKPDRGTTVEIRLPVTESEGISE